MAFHDYFRFNQCKNAIKLFLPISVAYFFFNFGWGLTTPIFSIFINKVTGDMFLTGIIIGVFGLVGILTDVPFGVLVDKISPKKIIQISLAAYLLVTIAYTFATNFWELLLVRIAHSLIGALMWVAVWAYIYSKVGRRCAAQEIGLFAEFSDVAATAAPLLGGLVVMLSFFAPFYLLSLFCFIAFIVITMFLPDIKNHSTHDGYVRLVKKEVFDVFKLGSNFYFLVSFIVVFYSVANVVGVFLPIILNQAGMGFEVIGVVIAVATLPAVLMEMPTGKFIDKIGRSKALLIGLLIASACTFMLSITFNSYAVIGIMFVFGVASVLLSLLANSVASSYLLKNERGGFSGIVTFFKDIGNFVGPVLGGLSLKLLGVSETMLAMTIIMLVTTPIFYFAFSRKQKSNNLKVVSTTIEVDGGLNG
jgi:MFS family permease